METNSASSLEASTTELRTELGKERLLVAELTHKLKDLERTHKHEISELKNMLAAEQQKTAKWRAMIEERNSVTLTELEEQLSEMSTRELKLMNECDSLKQYYGKSGVDLRLRELETLNYALKERVTSLEQEKQMSRNDAVLPK